MIIGRSYIKNINKWGIYRWFIEYGKEKIHEDDFEYFQKNINNSCVVECIDTIDDFIVIKYNDRTYKVKGNLTVELPEPKFKFGDVVIYKNNKDVVVKGIIADVMWHTAEKKNYYFLLVGGKKKSRRYFDNDIEKVKNTVN